MKVLYKSKKIEKLCNDERKLISEYGKEVATKLIAVINLLESAYNLKDILAFTQYRLHLLKGKYDGLFSMRLGSTTGFRLIIMPLDENENIVKNSTNVYTITVNVEIVEVSKHYE